MGFVPLDGAVQAELRFILNGQQVENVLYFYTADGVSVGEMNNLADMLNDWLELHLQPTQASGAVFNELYLTDLTSQTGPTVSNTARNGTIGQMTTSPVLPGNATIAVSFRTNGRGRSARGRNYFIGLAEGNVVGNVVDTGLVTAIEAAYNALLTVVQFPWTWIVYSRTVDGADRAEGLAQPVTNAIVVDPYVDSQRRRLTGRGQ